MAKKEKYESMRIMSLEGSVLYKNEGFSATKNGKPNPGAFRGVLDESLDTLKLAEVYDRHEDEIGYPYLDGKKRFCRAVVNLSFNRAVKVYESYGNRYVRNGYAVTDEDMQDHACVRLVNGRPTLIAIDVSFRENSGYAPVEENRYQMPCSASTSNTMPTHAHISEATRPYPRTPPVWRSVSISTPMASISTAFTTFDTSEAREQAVTVVAYLLPSR